MDFEKLPDDDKMNDDDPVPIEYKMILVGDTGVGKTSLFKKITSNTFNPHNVATIGIDRKTLELEITIKKNEEEIKKNININLVDTAGQERYKSVTQSYFKGSSGVLLLYNICDKKSFMHVKDWLDIVRNMIGNYEHNKYIVFLMGTKLDLVEKEESMREVTEDEANNLCEENDMIWYGECSNKDFTDENYKKIFAKFAQKMYEVIGYNKSARDTVASLTTQKTKKNKKKCHC